MTNAERAKLPGLRGDRAGSIAGGALIVQAVMQALGARGLIISGQGLRQGLLLEAGGRGLPDPRAVRSASIDALARRFRRWDPRRAERRARLADGLVRALDPRSPEDVREMLGHAARVLDVGQSVDHYRRDEHCAAILRETDLSGFSHRGVAVLTAIVDFAEDEELAIEKYEPLLEESDRGHLERAGVILTLADEIERRLPLDREQQVHCVIRRDSVMIPLVTRGAWAPTRLVTAFRRAFGRTLLARS